MLTDQALDSLINGNFGRVCRMFNYALRHGLTSRDELLSDYQWGIVKYLKAARNDGDTTEEQFLHYHGVCEVQSQFRLKKQRSMLNECPDGHTYAYNKGRMDCPQCGKPFSTVQKFQPIDVMYPAPEAHTSMSIEEMQKLVSLVDAPQSQMRVLKAMVSENVLIQEEHILSAAAKVTGISRQRVGYIVERNRPQLERIFHT